MKYKLFFRTIICAALVIGLALTGCDTGTNGSDGDSDSDNLQL